MRKERLPYYYEVLELPPSASSAEIKKAWLELVQVWHPDRFNHSPALHRKAEARTQMINQAYQTLPAGDYAIAEAPGLFCVERQLVADLYASTSTSSDNRARFLRELERLLPFPNRFLVIEGRIDQAQGRGRLSEYLKNGVMDFLDAVALKYGIQVILADTREEWEEAVANSAAMHYAYFYAEQEGLGRSLSENDL